jgi:transposase-like protein
MTRGEHELSIVHDIARRNVRHAEIVTDYLRGDAISEIAERYDLSEGSIGRIRALYNLPKRKPGVDPEVRDDVAALYRAKVPIKEIRERTGCDRKTIWIIARERHLKLRRPHHHRARRARA